MKTGMSEKGNRILYLVFSLLLAIVLWLYVDTRQGNTSTKTLTNLPIEFVGAEDTLPSKGLMLTEGADTTLDLTIRGPRTVISGFEKDDIRIEVDLSGINAVGTRTLPWDYALADNMNKSDISIEKQSRSNVTVQVATLYTKQVPVSVNVTGEVADVGVVESARITLDLQDANGTLQREFEYELLDGDGNVVENINNKIRVSDRRVLVTAPVYIFKDLKLSVKFKESPGSQEANTRWKLEYDTITVAGEPASLENVQEVVLAEIDLSTILSDTEIPLEISLPAGCVNLSGFTATTLSVRFRGLETKTFTATNISAVGYSEGQVFSKMTNSVDVVLRGPAAELEKVTADDIRVVVDLSEYVSNGTYSAPAIVLVDGHEEVGAVGTCTVAFKIAS